MAGDIWSIHIMASLPHSKHPTMLQRVHCAIPFPHGLSFANINVAIYRVYEENFIREVIPQSFPIDLAGQYLVHM